MKGVRNLHTESQIQRSQALDHGEEAYALAHELRLLADAVEECARRTNTWLTNWEPPPGGSAQRVQMREAA